MKQQRLGIPRGWYGTSAEVDATNVHAKQPSVREQSMQQLAAEMRRTRSFGSSPSGAAGSGRRAFTKLAQHEEEQAPLAGQE